MKLIEIKATRKALTLFRARAFHGEDEVYMTSFNKDTLGRTALKYTEKGFEVINLKPIEYTAVHGEVYDLDRTYISTFKNKNLISHVEI